MGKIIEVVQALLYRLDHDKLNSEAWLQPKRSAYSNGRCIHTRKLLRSSRTAFLAPVFSTSSKIFATVESSLFGEL